MRNVRGMLIVVFSIVVGMCLPQAVHAQGAPVYTLIDDPTGGDCLVLGGLWDNKAKSCTLTGEVFGYIVIAGNGITLDGNGFDLGGEDIIPYLSGSGVMLDGVTGVTVKNFGEIEGFHSGIHLLNSHDNVVIHNTVEENFDGIKLESSNGNLISGNVVYENLDTGIRNHIDGVDNVIRGNIVFSNLTGIRSC